MDTGRGYAPARPQDHRPTEPFGRGVDNPMVKESWKSLGRKTSGNLEVRVYKDTAWDNYAIEFFRSGKYLPDETYRAENADEAKEVIQNFFKFGSTV
jgi:hypothetical protein